MSKKEKVPQEPREVPVALVTDDHLEWLRLTAKLNAGSGGASMWHKDIYSCLCELKELRAARTIVVIDLESHPPVMNYHANGHFESANSSSSNSSFGSIDNTRSASAPFFKQ